MKRNSVILVMLCGLSAAALFFSFVLFDSKQRSPRAENDPAFFRNKDLKNMGELKISSPSFENNGEIPARYTCEGENISPALQISGVPKDALSLVLAVDDPDAVGGRVWDHWLLWNIKPETILISEGGFPGGVTPGLTSFGDKKYGGPCPPAGSGLHHYRFKLYALDSTLSISSDSVKSGVEKAMAGHIIDEALLVGTYERKKL